MDDVNNEESDSETCERSVPLFLLTPLTAPDNGQESSSRQFTSLDKTNLGYSEKACQSRLTSRADSEQTCGGDRATNTCMDFKGNSNPERLTPLSVAPVTTEGSRGIFRNVGIFTTVDNTILTVPGEQFHQDTTSPMVNDGQLLEAVHQNTEFSSNQDQTASKIAAEPKKRRGGWPKGKKRKKECLVDVNRPKAPMTGYVRFLNGRRDAVKAQHPGLPPSKITKLIGTEWNAMSVDEKQVYHDQAEDDKRRYLEELVAYQQSEAYQAFLKRQQSKKLKDLGVENLEGLDPNILTDNYDEAEESDELYCKPCSKHFSSEHNMKEHMLGRQHLQMIADEFEKEAQTTLNTKPQDEQSQPVEDLEKPPSVHEDESEISEATKMTTLSDVMDTLLQHNYDREMEIRELRKNLGDYENQQMLLSKELERLKKLVSEAEECLNARKSFGSALCRQLNELRMVPSLFGVLL